jgi:hypothetical protein
MKVEATTEVHKDITVNPVTMDKMFMKMKIMISVMNMMKKMITM